MAKRDRTAIVQLKVRMREPLRAHLEKAAAARGISLNSEIVDRLERSADRLGLLEEILVLAYGAAGTLMAGMHVHGGTTKLRLTDQQKIQIMDAVLYSAKVQE